MANVFLGRQGRHRKDSH